MFTNLYRAINAEVYKLRNNSIPVTVVVLPAVIVVTFSFVLPLLTKAPVTQRPGARPWLEATVGLLDVWSYLQGFIVAVITAQLAGMEHDNKRWKYLFALPGSRNAIYAAKIIVAIGLFGLSLVVILVGLIVCGLTLQLLMPEFNLDLALPLADMIGLMLVSFMTSWLMITLHSWAALHWSSFSPSIGLALVAFMLNLSLSTQETFSRIFPWSLPLNFFIRVPRPGGGVIDNEIAATSVLVSVIATLIIVPLSGWLVTRRDVL